MPATLEKSDSRASRTRSALLAAGFDLMAERPIDAIPIDDLVASAGVAKGSFFNHFSDKDGFAAAIAFEVRVEIEERVETANSGVDNPLERLAGGMREAASYALNRRKQSIVALRFSHGTTTRGHPLNKGVGADITACVEADHFREEAKETGVLYWLGLCHALMANIVENEFSQQEAATRLEKMLILGLTGLGADEETAIKVANDNFQILLRVQDATH